MRSGDDTGRAAVTAVRIRRFLGRTLASGMPFSHKAALGAEVLVRGCELCSALLLSITQGIAAMIVLGSVAVLIEYVARRLMGQLKGERRRRRRLFAGRPMRDRRMEPGTAGRRVLTRRIAETIA